MSAFAITSDHYLRAAQSVFESGSRVGYVDVLCATGQPHAYEAWEHFKNLFLNPNHMQFEDNTHCLTALLVMAAICEDEENDEEGQL